MDSVQHSAYKAKVRKIYMVNMVYIMSFWIFVLGSSTR